MYLGRKRERRPWSKSSFVVSGKRVEKGRFFKSFFFTYLFDEKIMFFVQKITLLFFAVPRICIYKTFARYKGNWLVVGMMGFFFYFCLFMSLFSLSLLKRPCELDCKEVEMSGLI